MKELKNIALQKLKIEDYQNPTSSSWESYTESESRINELLSLDAIKNNPSPFIHAFRSTPDKLKSQLTPLIKEWVDNFNEDDLNNKDVKELRDFIYEMF